MFIISGTEAVLVDGPQALDSAVIYIAKDYLEWQQIVLQILQSIPLDESNKLPLNSDFMDVVKSNSNVAKFDKKLMKDVMSFASFRMRVRI